MSTSDAYFILWWMDVLLPTSVPWWTLAMANCLSYCNTTRHLLENCLYMNQVDMEFNIGWNGETRELHHIQWLNGSRSRVCGTLLHVTRTLHMRSTCLVLLQWLRCFFFKFSVIYIVPLRQAISTHSSMIILFGCICHLMIFLRFQRVVSPGVTMELH